MTMPRLDPLPINRFWDRERDAEWTVWVMRNSASATDRRTNWALLQWCSEPMERMAVLMRGQLNHMQENWHLYCAPEVPDEEDT